MSHACVHDVTQLVFAALVCAMTAYCVLFSHVATFATLSMKDLLPSIQCDIFIYDESGCNVGEDDYDVKMSK